MTVGVEVRDLRLRYGRRVALAGLTLALDGGKIYGLLGRNGAGKSSLLAVLAGFLPAGGGTVRVGGADPFDNPRLAPRVCLIREGGDYHWTRRVRDVLDLAARLRPTWDADYAAALVDRFHLPLDTRVRWLSRGQRSALGVVLGLAGRAPLTIYDDAGLGMDAPSRAAFYDELLGDYLAHPRTVIVSTHLIEEVGPLFEEVVILDRGRVVAHEESDTLRSRGTSVTGPRAAVDRFLDTGALTVLGQRHLGGTKSAMVYGELTEPLRDAARSAGLELGPVAMQDLFVHLTEVER